LNSANLKIDYIDKVVGNSENSTKELNAIIKKEVYPEFFKAAESFKLVVLKKKLNKLGLDITARFPDDTKVVTVSFLYRMKEIFGNDWSDMLGWQDIQLNNPKKAKYNIDDLWHLHFAKTTNKATGESPFDFLKRFALEKLNLENSKAEVYAKIRLQQGYATLSLNAITKILPYLQRGFLYSEAVYLANIAKVLGVSNVSEEVVTHFAEEMRKIMKERFIQKNYLQAINELISDQLFAENRFGMYPSYKLDDADRKEIEGKLVAAFGKTTWEAMDELEKKNANNYVSTKYEEFLQKRIYAKDVFEKTERLHDIIFAWLKNTYNVPQNNIKYLWHPSEQETYRKAPEKDDIKYLGSPEPISKGFKNPMALKTLLRLKKLINYLIETRKIDENTRIVVEIARELNDANKRKAIERWQREREKENIVFKKKIEDINKECNAKFDGNDKNLIDKVRLWEEQKRICLYTGRTIDLCDLFNGSKYDIEHTVPASMSFDNEMKNLTLADKLYNQQIKGKQLPSECPNYATEQTFNGVRYSPIVETLQLVFGQLVEVEKKIKGKRTIIKQFQKIIDLEKEYQEWMDKTSDVKEIKDNIIIKRHYLKMDLDYWRYKLSTFTITEYKAGWRNSQLRDTQIITKYALPYLKTAFKKVDVQKGSITAYFRKIYKIQPRLDKKERTKHSHHAVDAAVLTLIPPSAIRDKIILKYNEAIENNKQYHEKPLNWDNFVTDDVLRIEREVMINYLPDHRTLVSTYKNVRKRGKIQFVKEKLENSRWQYKLDRDGNKIPLVAQGDSVRGQLHQETIFGAILKPKFDQNEKAINVKGEFLHDEKVSFVKRVHLAISAVNGFKYDKKEKDLTKFLKQFEDIIDPQVRNIVLTNINERLNNNCSPESVLIEPIYMLDKNGRNVNQIRRVRVFQGNINPPEIKKIGGSEGVYLSKHKHKQFAYAENTDYVSIACYKAITDGNKEKFHFKPFTALNFAKEKSFPTHEIQEGIEFSLFWELKPGRKVVLLKTKGEKLSELSKDAIRKRVYIVNNVYPAYVKKYEYFYANLNYHLVVVSSSIKLPQMGKSVNFDNPLEAPLVRLNLDPLKSYFAIEGIHFEIMLDGEIIVK